MPFAVEPRHRAERRDALAVIPREHEWLHAFVVATITEVVEFVVIAPRRKVDRDADFRLAIHDRDARHDGCAQETVRRRQKILEDRVGLIEAGLPAFRGDEQLEPVDPPLQLQRLADIGRTQVVTRDIRDGRGRTQFQVIVAERPAQDDLGALRRRGFRIGVVNGAGFRRDAHGRVVEFAAGHQRGLRADEGTAADAASGGKFRVGVVTAAQQE